MAFEWGGVKLLTRTVRDTLGVKIDHFVEIDFRGFKKVVHDLGGLWLPVDQRYFNQNLHTPGTNYADDRPEARVPEARTAVRRSSSPATGTTTPTSTAPRASSS